MRIQDYFIETTARAGEEFFRYAKGVPAEKLEWVPIEGGRSVIDMAREVAMCPEWAASLLSAADEGSGDEAEMTAARELMNSWSTPDECEAEFLKRNAALTEIFLHMPDERLTESKWLPYGGGRDFSMVEMMEYPSWNANYHTGQVAYIQTLYGDKEMY